MGVFLLILFRVFFFLFLIFFSSCSLQKREKNPIGILFYQPLLKDKIDWDKSFQKMSDCKIDKLILQWSRFGVVDFIKDDKWLTPILQNAQKYNIKVVIGLYGDDRYFKILEDRKTDIKKYLNSLKRINIAQAKKIYAIARNYSSFNGWYIYDEIDDTNFIEPNRQIYLKEYLQFITDKLDSISLKPIYISGYFSNHMTPKEYVKMFVSITPQKYILLVQSGIGANLVNYKNSIRYMKEFDKSFKREFIPIVEGFKFENSKAVAIDFKSLQRQIKLLQDSSKIKRVALFSFRYFFTKELSKNYCNNYID